MKRIQLLKKTIGAFCFFAITFCATGQEQVKRSLQEPQNFADSLKLAKEMIDEMSIVQLSQQKERFTYLNRTQPSRINSEVLLYIDEKIKSLKK